MTLASLTLPLRIVAAGARLSRIHRRTLDPIYFSPGPGQPPRNRFDSASGRFGVLYAAEEFAVCFAETLLREPTVRLVNPAAMMLLAASTLELGTGVRLVDLTGPGLSRLGLDARFLAGPYEACGAWADALHDHPSRPDGLLYPSRFDPSGTCVALFDHLAPSLSVRGSVPLADRPGEVAAVLDRYGKAALAPD